MKLSIYRYNPETDAKPYMQAFDIAPPKTAKMLLDALVFIKAEVDDSLALRRSCREGVCGSDGVNINGKNGLACTTPLAELKEADYRPPAAGAAGDSRFGGGHEPVLQAIRIHQALFAKTTSRHPKKSAASRPPSAPNWTACMSAFFAPAARLPARRFGGIPTSLSARLVCCRPTALSPTAETPPRASGWTIWKTPTVFSAATPL